MKGQPRLIDEERQGEKVYILLSFLPRPEDIVGPPPARHLIESIRTHGFEGALRLSRGPDGQLFVRAGGRRIKALWALREEGEPPYDSSSYAVPAFVRDLSVTDDNLAALADNGTARPNHVARFLALHSLSKAGVGEKTIASQTGLAVGTIRQTLKLRGLLGPLLDGFLHGDVSYTAALKLVGMTRGQQERAAAILDEKGELTIAVVNALRQAQASESLDEFFGQEDMFEAVQIWPLTVDSAGNTATVTMPDGTRLAVDLERFVRFIESGGGNE
jgi:ParB-like chromosome segregation protein Spo0J